MPRLRFLLARSLDKQPLRLLVQEGRQDDVSIGLRWTSCVKASVRDASLLYNGFSSLEQALLSRDVSLFERVPDYVVHLTHELSFKWWAE